MRRPTSPASRPEPSRWSSVGRARSASRHQRTGGRRRGSRDLQPREHTGSLRAHRRNAPSRRRERRRFPSSVRASPNGVGARPAWVVRDCQRGPRVATAGQRHRRDLTGTNDEQRRHGRCASRQRAGGARDQRQRLRLGCAPRDRADDGEGQAARTRCASPGGARRRTGLLGSTAYVEGLSSAERERIAMYMNYDMVGSPNYIFMVYDADQSSFAPPAGVPIPAGSEAIEDLYESYYTSVGEPYDDTQFSGRSDYQAFIEAGFRRAVCSRAPKGSSQRSSSRSGEVPQVSSSTRVTTSRATRSKTAPTTRSRSTATSSRTRS